MNWKLHAAIALVLIIPAAYFLLHISNIQLLLALSTFGILSALLPDIDLKNSKVCSLMDIGAVVAVCVLVLFKACVWRLCMPPLASLPHMAFSALAMLGGYFLLFFFLTPRHRGITHSLVACLVFSVLVYLLLGREFAAAGAIGYLSHLLADMEMEIKIL